MSTWSFYRLEDGRLTGQTFSGPPRLLEANTPQGCGSVAGAHDHLTRQVALDSGQVVDWQPPAPAADESTTWSWDTEARRWIATPTLQARVLRAHAEIDTAAGAARLRYITEVPGQQAVYLRKLEQARTWLADGGDPPPYIAAEAAATEQTPLQVAEGIVAVAEQWDDVLSPAIEGARMAGKRAVSAAAALPEAPADAVQATAQAAIAALQAL